MTFPYSGELSSCEIIYKVEIGQKPNIFPEKRSKGLHFDCIRKWTQTCSALRTNCPESEHSLLHCKGFIVYDKVERYMSDVTTFDTKPKIMSMLLYWNFAFSPLHPHPHRTILKAFFIRLFSSPPELLPITVNYGVLWHWTCLYCVVNKDRLFEYHFENRYVTFINECMSIVFSTIWYIYVTGVAAQSKS